ncbi:serine hydrolase domain-containing protein [Methylobacterium sp. NEAU 140]|uniref:serine hydrolase domain-containing protein n=1 Tax=Methylobacterium sp. NEAU 140 TaxID=3064945 RepID=UPI0027342D92|nr:serine hydrolase domain-containing protein [Methylobacterium sp. NEAU 140]MDP4021525.1 serine hydrolase domain-containing protein [Methylobacterium sp. NEAU 140]
MPHPVTRGLRAGLLALGVLAAGVVPCAAFDSAPAPVEAGQAGFDAARLKAIGDFVQRDIAAGKIPGMVLMILRDGKPVMFEAFGERAPGSPMQKDSLHRIASTTKLFVTTAALRLYEQGRFKLADPVATYLPELKTLTVYGGAESATDGEAPPPAAPRRAPTIEDLLKHTAGLTYWWIGPLNPVRRNQRDQDLEGLYGLTGEEMLTKLGQQPLLYQPGSTFEYSIATDVLGHLLERIEQKPLDRIVSEQVLQPLGLTDTVWQVDEARAGRLAEPSQATLAKDPLAWVYGWLDLRKPPKRFSGGAGLASTAGDVGRLLQMLANGGALDGVRLLSPQTVRFMLNTDHLAGLRGPRNNVDEGYGWSLVNPVRLATGAHTTPGAPGDVYWGGITGPRYMIDPSERLVVVALFQAPSLRGHYYALLRQMIYGAMVK